MEPESFKLRGRIIDYCVIDEWGDSEPFVDLLTDEAPCPYAGDPGYGVY